MGWVDMRKHYHGGIVSNVEVVSMIKKGNDITSDVDIEAVYKQIKDCVNEKQLYVESYNHMQI